MSRIAVTTYTRTDDSVEMTHESLGGKWFLRCRHDQDVWYWNHRKGLWAPLGTPGAPLGSGFKQLLMDYDDAWELLNTIPAPPIVTISVFPKRNYEKVPSVT